jgi:hypothetical protein
MSCERVGNMLEENATDRRGIAVTLVTTKITANANSK